MILDLMRRRRSIRRFQQQPVPEALLLQLVEAATTAPSPGNRQPWRFLIVRTRERIAAAATVVREESRRLGESVRPEYTSDFAAYARHFSGFETAPILVVPLFRGMDGISQMLGEHASEADAALLQRVERHGVLVSVSLAVQNILLMVEECGLGACCLTGPLVAGARLSECLDVPDGWEIAALIAVGVPDERPASPGRKPASAFMRWL
jgi:nitroreductase